MVEVREVTNRKEKTIFIQFANKLYKDCPYYCPTLDMDERGTFSSKNPVLEFSEYVLYLAYKEGKVVGRIAGLINHKANDHWHNHNLRFGWFDFIDDMEVSKALLDTVVAWGKARGMTAMNGPVGFTDMDKEGLVISGYEYLVPMAVLYNYPYYVKHFEAYGLRKEVDWHEFQVFVDQMQELPVRMVRVAETVKDRFHLHIRKIHSPKELLKTFGTEYFDVLSDAYSVLYNYQPLTQKQKDYYSQYYFPLLNFDFVSIVCNEKEEIVAVGLGMPDVSKALKKANGSLWPFHWIGLLKALKAKQIDTIDTLLIAVRPDYQDKGVTAMIFAEQFPYYKQYGVKILETTSILESNHKNISHFLMFPHKQHRQRRAYIKEI